MTFQVPYLLRSLVETGVTHYGAKTNQISPLLASPWGKKKKKSQLFTHRSSMRLSKERLITTQQMRTLRELQLQIFAYLTAQMPLEKAK